MLKYYFFLLYIINLSVLLGWNAFLPNKEERKIQRKMEQQAAALDSTLQLGMQALDNKYEQITQHMKILQIISEDSCLVTISPSNEVIHVVGVKTTALVDGNYLPQNNIFFYDKCISDLIGGFQDNVIINRITLVDNGLYSYITSINTKKTIKSYKYIPFTPKKTQRGEIRYLNQNITEDEFYLLWKKFAYQIFIYKGKDLPYGIKLHTHFIFSLDKKNIAGREYYHINSNEFIFYLNNGGKIFEKGYTNIYVTCTRCKGTGIIKDQQCTRCLGKRKIPQKRLAYNLVTIEALKNYTKNYLDKKAKLDKDSEQDKNTNDTLIQDQDKDISENNDLDDANIIDQNKTDKD